MTQENSSSGGGLNLTFFIVLFVAMLLFFAILTPSMYGIGPRGSSPGENDIFFQQVDTMAWALGYLLFLSGIIVILSQIPGPLKRVIGRLMSPEKDRRVLVPSLVFAVILYGAAIVAAKVSFAVFSLYGSDLPPQWMFYAAAAPWVIGLLLIVFSHWRALPNPAEKRATLKMFLSVLPTVGVAVLVYWLIKDNESWGVRQPHSFVIIPFSVILGTLLGELLNFRPGGRLSKWKREEAIVKMSLYWFSFYAVFVAVFFAIVYALEQQIISDLPFDSGLIQWAIIGFLVIGLIYRGIRTSRKD